MELFSAGMTLLVAAFLFVLGLVLLLTVFGLPGNWLMILLVALCNFVLPGTSSLGVWYWGTVLGVAALGEVLEFLLQVKVSKKYGSSATGTVGGVIGALVGAILMAPLLFGIGAFIGALLGAWSGCFLFELMRGKEAREASKSAMGAMFGRFLGTSCKLACGVVIWAVTMQYIWPDPQNLPFDFRWLPKPGPAAPDATQVLGLVQSLLA